MAWSPEWLVGKAKDTRHGVCWKGLVNHVSSAYLPSCRLYVHSAVANWKKCLHSIKLKDSVLSLVYVAPTEGWG